MTKESAGFSVRIFIPSGEPDGLRIIEKSNWTGHGLVFPRPVYPDARKRAELGKAGVYILWGPGQSSELPRVYIGEGDGVLPRLDEHAKNKDFWTHAVVFTSKDRNLNKAHVQYLESRLVALASEAKRCELDNGNAPQLPALSEADAADALSFLSDILLCLPIIGVSLFEKAKASAPKFQDLILKGKGIEARGIDGTEGFVVRAGSTASKTEAPSLAAHLMDFRKALVAKGVLVDTGEFFRVSQDYTFSSPSAAGAVLLGRSTNGRTEWKNAAGKTLKEIQDQATSV
jgi:hypothetical protein